MQDKHEKPIHGFVPLINRTESIIPTARTHTRQFKGNASSRLESGVKLTHFQPMFYFYTSLRGYSSGTLFENGCRELI